MTLNTKPLLETDGLFVDQPFGEFVVALIPAETLLQVAYSDRLRAERNSDGTYRLEGTQRKLIENRLKSISSYIEGANAAFPNSIILAANFRSEDGLIEENPDLRWSFSINDLGRCRVSIPTNKKLAPVIDGQHRLFGFHGGITPERLKMPLVCAIYFDLPRPYQAHLFATINSNQRPVSKSQTYELFGYNIEDEPAVKWNPEKLAVFLTRKLNADEASPLRNHIAIAAENDFALTAAAARKSGTWVVSLATIVEGIVGLISSNPKVDSAKMDGELRYEANERSTLISVVTKEAPPLRDLYISNADDIIYASIKNFFTAIDLVFFQQASGSSYIRKAVGVQALMGVAKLLMSDAVKERKISADWFVERLKKAGRINFEDPLFQPSGLGKQHIYNCITIFLNLQPVTPKLKLSKHWKDYERVLDAANYGGTS
jgi:DNA phosphorothioation-associated DGQHR protein 1